MSKQLSAKQLHGKFAVAHRVGSKTPPKHLEELRRDYVAALLAEHVEEVMKTAPEFTPAQMNRIFKALTNGASS